MSTVQCFDIAKWHYLYPHQVRDIIKANNIPYTKASNYIAGYVSCFIVSKDDYLKHIELFKNATSKPPSPNQVFKVKEENEEKKEKISSMRSQKMNNWLTELASAFDGYVSLISVAKELGIEGSYPKDQLRKKLQHQGVYMIKRGFLWFIKKDELERLSEKTMNSILARIKRKEYSPS
jgi:hypothetical protein